MSVQSSYDVIIVGAGGSGLAAAVSAAEHGVRVVVLEKLPYAGGTTRLAVGSFTASNTAEQERANISDDVEAHVEDAAKFAPPEIETRGNVELRRSFLSDAAATLEWLKGMGLTFHGPSPEPPNRAARMHNVIPNGRAYVDVLKRRLIKLGGHIYYDAKVTEILRSADKVVGVKLFHEGKNVETTARLGVALAAGDYAASAELIARFKGDGFARIDGINTAATGDGHVLAESVGARLVNMDVTYGPELRFVRPPGKSRLDSLPSSGVLAGVIRRAVSFVPGSVLQRVARRVLVTWHHPEDAVLADGAILVNREGRRFVNELESPARETAAALQTGKECFFLLDCDLIERYSQWPHFISTAPQIAYAYVQDYLRLRPDIALRARSLSELARRGGLDAHGLVDEVASYNARLEAEHTDTWGRSHGRKRLTSGDWVLLGPAKAYFTTTEGGAAIDIDCRVLDAESGRPIPGLYAVGQNGLGGQVLWGHGLHIAWAMTSGRRVGEVLARISRQNP